MTDELATVQPSAWVARFAPLIPVGGQVLEIAGGESRSSPLLSQMGYRVEAVVTDAADKVAFAALPGVTTRIADLERGPWPYFGRAFDGIVVTHFLWRPLLPNLFACLENNGILIYEAAMATQDNSGSSLSPEHLLRPGELLDLLHKRFTLVAFEQGEISGGSPAATQRIVVRRGLTTRIP